MIFTPFIIKTNDLDNSNITIVYNTLTTSLISLSNEDYNRIFVDGMYTEQDENSLIKNGFLIDSKEDVLLNWTDVLSIKRVVDKELKRKKVRETNIGEKIIQEISILNSLREHRYMN